MLRCALLTAVILAVICASPMKDASAAAQTGRPGSQAQPAYGVVICEPVPAAGAEALGDFGAGCARWLHFVVGGHGELGKTPTWSAADRARMELKLNRLRITEDGVAG